MKSHILVLISIAWQASSMRVTNSNLDYSKNRGQSKASMIPGLMGRVTAPLVRRGAGAVGRQSVRNYGSGPLPLGYWRPQGPAYRPRAVVTPPPVKDLVPIKPNNNALVPFRPQPKALVPFRRPVVAPLFQQATRPTVVPPAMRFNHLRVLGGVGAVGAAAWSHGFWGRDYSLIPVEGSDGEKPEWLASTVDPETEEATGRYLVPEEIAALGLNEDSSGENDDTDPCATWTWSNWWSCLLPTSEEDVPDEAEVIVTNGPEICRDAIAGCEESSCDNGQRPFCAKTCGLYPCPPVESDQSAELVAKSPELAGKSPELAGKSPAKSPELAGKSPELAGKSPARSPELAAKSPELPASVISDAQIGCNIMSCMSLAGRMLCMKTCSSFFTNPAGTPANETVADLDTTGDSYPGCTILNCMTLVGRLMCQKTCHFHPSQEVPKNPPLPITDIEDVDLDLEPYQGKSPYQKKSPYEEKSPYQGKSPRKREHIKIEYDTDNSSSAEDSCDAKCHMDHVMEDELHAQEEQKPTLPEVVLDGDSNSAEIMQILDKATREPEVLLKGEELHDSLCTLLTVGAFDCISVDSMCRCFYLRLPTEDHTDCSHIYPNKKSALTVLKNQRLALFPYDQCRCYGSQKTLHRGNEFSMCDLSPFSS